MATLHAGSGDELPTLDELIECWKAADDHFRLREQTFSTRTCNLGGAHSERFENRLENIKRSTNTTIPHYNPLSDPHLVNYRKKLMTNVPGRPSSKRKSKVLAIRERVKGERSEDDLTRCVVTPPLGTEHILELKKLFWKNSEEFTGICCRSPFCAVATAGVEHERVRIINVRQLNLHELISKGISITNGFCSLHEHLPVPIPSMALLFDWLVLLNSLDTIDWPGFLLLCTANLQKEWPLAAQLRNSYECFVQQRPTTSELAFHELVAFLHFNHGHNPNDVESKLTSFFQPGDFYRARHICNFAEAVFALQPRRIQFYLYKANARGQRMITNFCGHTSVTVNPIGMSASEAQKTASKRAASAKLRPAPNWTNFQVSDHQRILKNQSQQLRYNRRVWA